MAHIQYLLGSIFDAKTQTIVNTVNCRGIMGKGLALAFKERYPDMFPVYQQECKEGRLHIGRPTLYKGSSPWILNFPTKDNWRANSKLEDIEKGLEYFVKNYKQAGIQSVAFPKLGAQNGKLAWDEVGPLMAQYLSRVDIPVYIYIADEDQKYQACTEENRKEQFWVHLSELALFSERLKQDLQINKKDAKKIADRRAVSAFTSIIDIEEIPGLAKATLKKIKDYFIRQQYKEVELIVVPVLMTSQTQGKKRYAAARNVRRKKLKNKDEQSKQNEIVAMALFD